MTKESTTRYIVREYYDDDKKLDARWHYDLNVTKNGPVLVENFNLPRKERKKKANKVAE
jgi:hypothetical protein